MSDAGVKESRCEQCGARFLIGADHGRITTEVDDDVWCNDGRVRRPPLKVEHTVCFFCLDDEEYDPEQKAGPPQRWQYGHC
jgi:hypothetical protein